jgi:hypothetical protein
MGLLYRVYVDEAGDRGLSPRSSQHFVVSAVVVADAEDAAVRAQLSATRAAVGRNPRHVIHFQKLTHSQRLKAAQDLAQFSIAMVTNVVVRKDLLGQAVPTRPTPYISHPDPMYLWALRLLLERVSWFCDEQGSGEAIVTVAHVRHFKVQKLHGYRQALELAHDVQIRWGVFAPHRFRIAAPSQVEMLQAADVAASSLFKAVEPDAYGNTERRYLSELRPVLYRRRASNVTSYGLKVFPTPPAGSEDPLAFLRSY